MKRLFGNAQSAHIDVELLSGYLDNQVTAGERARIEEHVKNCAACYTELQSLRQTVAMLQALPRVPVPRAFTLSEAQVGIRRPVERAPWYVGALRGLAVVGALLLVVFLATDLLRIPGQSPATQIARAPAATQPATEAAIEAFSAGDAAQETAADPATEPSLRTIEPEAMKVAPAEEASEPAEEAAPEAAGLAATPSALPTQAPTNPSPEQPAQAPVPSPELQAEAPAIASAPAEEEAGVAMVAPDAEEPAGVPLGRGGGGPDAGEPLPPEAPPPLAPVEDVLPESAKIAYASADGLHAVDQESGDHPLLSAENVTMPLISDDGAWIAYLVMTQQSTEVWAVRWDGSDAHRVLADADLPPLTEDGSEIQRRVMYHLMRWVPGEHALAFSTFADILGPEYRVISELWNVDVEGGTPQLVLNQGVNGDVAYSPDGTMIALLERGGPTKTTGSLSIFNADGSQQRLALEFPANVNGHLSHFKWGEDGSGLWAGIADPNMGIDAKGSFTLYWVTAGGTAEQVNQIAALDTYWSPDGTQLAYTQAVTETLENRHLILANGDGTQAEIYDTLSMDGWFLGWSPDGERFLYQSEQQVYLGAAGEAPRRLGNTRSVIDPRWVSADQIVYLSQQQTHQVMIFRPIEGEAVSLMQLPVGVTYDVSGP